MNTQFYPIFILLIAIIFIASCKKKDPTITEPPGFSAPVQATTTGMPSNAIVDYNISGDGRFVVLVTTSALLAADNDNFADVYRFDRSNNTLQLISTNLNSMLLVRA